MRAFVTGAGSGFGRAIARRMLREGWTVVATDVSVADLAGLSDGVPDGEARLTLLALDLRDPGTIEAAARIAIEAGPIDVLVNNAGYAVFGTAEDADLAAIASLFDANVMGTARVTRALLPALRAARGSVVQISSIAGRMVFPESGFYAATKFALEAMSEALVVENTAFGLRVIVIEPGAFDTGFAARATRASRPRPADGANAERYPLWDARKMAVLSPPQDPDVVASAVWAALAGGPRFQRVRVGEDSERILNLRDTLGPDGWVRFMVARVGGPAEESPVATPAAVLAASDDALRSERPFVLARAARDAGMLDDWTESESGRLALTRLG